MGLLGMVFGLFTSWLVLPDLRPLYSRMDLFHKLLFLVSLGSFRTGDSGWQQSIATAPRTETTLDHQLLSHYLTYSSTSADSYLEILFRVCYQDFRVSLFHSLPCRVRLN